MGYSYKKFHKLIRKYIEIIKMEDATGDIAEFCYEGLNKSVDFLIDKYNDADSASERAFLYRQLDKANQEVFFYLAGYNRYDQKMLEIYKKLESLESNI